MSRMMLLTEGMSNPAEAKTATGLLRYRGEEVAAVYDSACAGRTAGEDSRLSEMRAAAAGPGRVGCQFPQGAVEEAGKPVGPGGR